MTFRKHSELGKCWQARSDSGEQIINNSALASNSGLSLLSPSQAPPSFTVDTVLQLKNTLTGFCCCLLSRESPPTHLPFDTSKHSGSRVVVALLFRQVHLDYHKRRYQVHFSRTLRCYHLIPKILAVTVRGFLRISVTPVEM